MNETTSMTIRVKRDVKEQAQELFNTLGMDMTTAINVFLRQAIVAGGIPFEIKVGKTPNKRLKAAIKESERLLKDPHSPGFNTMEELKAYLES